MKLTPSFPKSLKIASGASYKISVSWSGPLGDPHSSVSIGVSIILPSNGVILVPFIDVLSREIFYRNDRKELSLEDISSWLDARLEVKYLAGSIPEGEIIFEATVDGYAYKSNGNIHLDLEDIVVGDITGSDAEVWAEMLLLKS